MCIRDRSRFLYGLLDNLLNVYISLVSDNGLSVIIKLFLQFLGVTGETVVCTKAKLLCNLAVILDNFDRCV